MERVLAANPWLQASGYATVMSLPQVDLSANVSWAGYRLAEFTCPELQGWQLQCPEDGSATTSQSSSDTLHNIPIVAISVLLLLILTSFIVCAVRRQVKRRVEAEHKDWAAHVASGVEELRGGEGGYATTSEPRQQAEEAQLPLTVSPSDPSELSVANKKSKLLSDLREQFAIAQV